MALLNCADCESPVSSKARACLNCGCPVAQTIRKNNQKKQKAVLISVGVFLLVAGIVWGVLKVASIPDRSGYYNRISWGTSSEDILKKLPDTAELNEDKTTIFSNEEDFSGLTGVDALAMYKLENNSLVEITILISNPYNTSFTANRIIEEIISDYDERYGAHTTEVISTVWKTEKSKIKLVHFTEELISLTFFDINYLDSEVRH